MKKLLSIVFVSLIAITFTGCRSAHIQNVQSQNMALNKTISNDDVFKSILRAGSSLGWVITKINDNTAEGRIDLRRHSAVVVIKFSSDNKTANYSITYKSSLNLDYNPADNTIHKNYNGWIHNLNTRIRSELSLLY